ncbi:small ribosomal subunit protein uS11m-like isoform X2 [Liolophura sinensis]|uniref:small ribosomal subunit protein uS11m-like isoform X2 n=1 Tax=Liolophura sinensis TaxID=3198878 RepID=UPI0031584558
MMLRSIFGATEKLYSCCVLPKQWNVLHKFPGIRITSVRNEGAVRATPASVTLGVMKEDSSDEPAVNQEDLRLESLFPSADTHGMLIEGTRYDELPIIHIKSTQNNTVVCVTKHTGEAIALSSGGMEGFRNARKGTTIAAQAAGISVGQKSVKKGITTVRVCVRGLGPGRLPAIKGLQMGGVNIVSITDTTRINQRGPRPRKQRRL